MMPSGTLNRVRCCGDRKAVLSLSGSIRSARQSATKAAVAREIGKHPTSD